MLPYFTRQTHYVSTRAWWSVPTIASKTFGARYALLRTFSRREHEGKDHELWQRGCLLATHLKRAFPSSSMESTMAEI